MYVIKRPAHRSPNRDHIVKESRESQHNSSHTAESGQKHCNKVVLEQLYKKHWGILCGWLRKRYGNGPPDPEDIAQTAFEIMASENLQQIENISGLLYTIASRRALNEIRGRANLRKFIDKELSLLGLEVEEITPERVYIARDRFKKIRDDLVELDTKQREVIIRSRVLGQTYDEISAVTGWSPAAISRYKKAAMTQIMANTKGKENIGQSS